MIADQETITIGGVVVTITTVETSNTTNRFYASSSYKSIDGAGKTITEAKERCIDATRMQIAFDQT